MKAHRTDTKLKILMLSDRLLMGGLETHLYDLCGGLRARGHKVFLNAPFVEKGLAQRFANADVTLIPFPNEADFDIIHAHPWTWGLLRGVELAVHTGKPLIATYHGRYRVGWDEIRRHASDIVVVSPEIRNFLHSGIVIENGIDVRHFTPTEKNFVSERFVISFVGRLDGERWRALKVLAEVSEGLGLQCHVVGDPSDLVHRPTGWNREFVWHGALQDIRPVLSQSDLVFSTGRGVRESMAMGRPSAVLNSNEYDGLVTSASVERVREYNFSGRATKRKPTAELLAADIERLMTDEPFRRSLAQWGRQYAEDNFDFISMIKQHEEIYYRHALPS